MKVKDLIGKLDDTRIVSVNGRQYHELLSEDLLEIVSEMDISCINIKAKNMSDVGISDSRYSFEVGV